MAHASGVSAAVAPAVGLGPRSAGAASPAGDTQAVRGAGDSSDDDRWAGGFPSMLRRAGEQALHFGAFWLGAMRFHHPDDMPGHFTDFATSTLHFRKHFQRVAQPGGKAKAKAKVARRARLEPERLGRPDSWQLELDVAETHVAFPQFVEPKSHWAPQWQTSAWTRPRHDHLERRELRFNADDDLDIEDDAEVVDDGIKAQRLPLFTVFQMLLAFFLWASFGAHEGSSVGGLDGIWPSRTDLRTHHDCVDHRSEIWRWFTYQFTHGSFAHIGWNCLSMLVLGIPLEGFDGHIKLFLMFNVGVFGGALCFFVSDVHTQVIGMSGGCYSLWGMHFADAIMNFQERKRAKQVILFLVLIFVIEVLMYLAQSTETSHAAHVGGCIAGLLIGIVYGRNKVVRSYEQKMRLVTVIVGIALIVFCLAWYAQWPPRTVFDSAPWCWATRVKNASEFGDTEYHCVRCNDQSCMAHFSPPFQLNVAGGASNARCGGVWARTER
eukprot:TRINITY_DN64335_c0_g1_i1.p1 TRINITY_DN64335_c0_g1~~TRINITY_DN64335_c0_g1_i1.p1  ORF type:complete len:493 (-),score=60.67 TRINITY_DN64335_c0_g1_i1:52-1530(-)